MSAPWSIDPSSIVLGFEKRKPGERGDSGALIMWAVWTVDSLYYLTDIVSGDLTDSNPDQTHNRATKDVAHIRWATSSAITALDLCAAAIARDIGLSKRKFEFDLRDIVKHKSKLPSKAETWLDNVLADSRYDEVIAARNPLVHSRVLRHFSTSEPKMRVAIQSTSPAYYTAAELVQKSKELATEHVQKFLEIVKKL
jgi:hypothetical protein